MSWGKIKYSQISPNAPAKLSFWVILGFGGYGQREASKNYPCRDEKCKKGKPWKEGCLKRIRGHFPVF